MNRQPYEIRFIDLAAGIGDAREEADPGLVLPENLALRQRAVLLQPHDIGAKLQLAGRYEYLGRMDEARKSVRGGAAD